MLFIFSFSSFFHFLKRSLVSQLVGIKIIQRGHKSENLTGRPVLIYRFLPFFASVLLAVFLYLFVPVKVKMLEEDIKKAKHAKVYLLDVNGEGIESEPVRGCVVNCLLANDINLSFSAYRYQIKHNIIKNKTK